MIVPLYEHQKKALEKLRSGSILCGGVGSGKSRTALAYFYQYECDRMRRPKPLYIITTARKRDSLEWEGECAYFCISKHDDSTLCPLVIDSWNNIQKYVQVENAFFIFDEQRVVGSGAWVRDFLKITRRGNRWILLSATPGDTWLDYLPVFIANGFYKNKTEFLRKHVVFSRFSKYPKVERYLDEQHLWELRRRVVVEMPFERHTISHSTLVKCDHNRHALMRVYRGRWNIFTNTPIQQAGEWCYCMRRCVNSDESRLQALFDIFEKHKKLIVFYNFDYELEALKRELEGGFLLSRPIVAEYNGHIHGDLPEGDEWIYLVQYNAASEAWNCTTTDTMVFYSLNYSYKIMLQASGRINRANTPYNHLYYYVLYSESIIDKSILTALKNKRKFNENKFYTKRIAERRSMP